MLRTRPTLIVLGLTMYFADVLFIGFLIAYTSGDQSLAVFKKAFLVALLHFPLFIAYTWKTWKNAKHPTSTT